MQEKFELWCLVELFGHTKIAGRCTEQNIAGTNMLRVDVPETKSQPAFTRFFGSSAIYSINPIDEETAMHYAEKLEIKPIDSWDISQLAKKHRALMRNTTPSHALVDNDNSDDDEGFDLFQDDNSDDDEGFDLFQDDNSDDDEPL